MKSPKPAPTVLLTPRLLDIESAAAYLGGVSTWTLRSWIADGLLRPVNLPGVKQSNGRKQKETNRRLLFDRLDLDAFIESRRGV